MTHFVSCFLQVVAAAAAFFDRQFRDLHFFRVGYWKCIGFLAWCPIFLILHVPHSLGLISARLKEQSFTSSRLFAVVGKDLHLKVGVWVPARWGRGGSSSPEGSSDMGSRKFHQLRSVSAKGVGLLGGQG